MLLQGRLEGEAWGHSAKSGVWLLAAPNEIFVEHDWTSGMKL